MRNPQVDDDTSDSYDVQHIETPLSEDSEYSIEHEDDEDDESEPDVHISEIFENYSPPNYDLHQNEEEITIDNQFAWILIWILNFRIRFNISETATESLIKFMKLVLAEVGGGKFTDFPSSLYLAKKSLDLKDRFHSFVPCTNCHKLYNKDEVVNLRQNERLSIMKCNHVEFPNSSVRRA
jgi:hypothetical protein